MVADRRWLTDSLRRSLEALALPGDAALRQAPEGTVRADELALDFDHFFTAYLGNFGAEWTDAQRHALNKVNNLLAAMSGAENAELWTEGAIIEHPRWAEVREAAQQAMTALGWQIPTA
jgi:hypothetical protein